MWSRLKRLCTRRPAQPPASRVRVDDAGIWRDAGAAGVTEFWPWANVREFGFRLLLAGFPDPWSGDYLEASWFIRVPSDGGGLLAVDFDADALDPDNLPPALLRRLPGLDLAALRQGVAARARGDGLREENGWPGAATPRTPRHRASPATADAGTRRDPAPASGPRGYRRASPVPPTNAAVLLTSHSARGPRPNSWHASSTPDAGSASRDRPG